MLKLKSLPWILLLALIVRLAVWMFFAGTEIKIIDAQDYDRLATGLVETGRYITPSGEYSSLRPPLYPWLISVSYRLFGVGNLEPIRFAQMILSLLNIAVIYRIGLVVFSAPVACWAAILMCFYPSLLAFNNLILTETLSTFLVSTATWLTIEAIRCKSIMVLVPAAILLGFGALTRSILSIYVPVYACYLAAAWPSKRPSRIVAACLTLVAFAAVIAPWAYRNTKIQNAVTLVDVMGGRNLMMGNYEHTPLERSWATIDIAQGEQSWFSVLKNSNPDVQTMTQGQRDKAAMKYGLHFMATHPMLTLKRTIVRFFNFWQLDRTIIAGMAGGNWGEISKLTLLACAAIISGFYACTVFAALFGVFNSVTAEPRYYWLLILNIAFPCLVHSLIFAHSRYHLPVMPLVMLFSAVAIDSRMEIWRASNSDWRFWLPVAFCSLLALSWIREFVMVDFAILSGGLIMKLLKFYVA